MSELLTDCPRCGANHVTFDVLSEIVVSIRYGWQKVYEAFSVCRHCHQSTVFVLCEANTNGSSVIKRDGLSKPKYSINDLVSIEKYISTASINAVNPPEYLPENINAVFIEGAKCFAAGCYNAAASMFRLCLDMTTNSLLPENDVNGLNSKIKRSLGLRLAWLLDNKYIPEAMRELSHCIKEDGNDAAHEGTLSIDDAEDILDFTYILLERTYTEPERLRLAKERRTQRRS
jgi:hypothetical protein